MTTIDDLLTAILYRLSCPEPETLGDYHLGRLAPGERLVVARHLRDCPHCARELELYASPEKETESVLDNLRGVISQVLWATSGVGAPSVPVLRGDPYAPHVYQAGDVQVVVEIQPAASGYRRQRLMGQVEPAGIVTEVELWHGTEVLASSIVDNEGYFSIDRLKSGEYTLCLRGDRKEIWLEVVVAE